MKKIGLFLLMVCLVFGNIAFAGDAENDEIAQKVLFTIPIDGLDLYDVSDFDYNPKEGLIYLITGNEFSTDDEEYVGYQFTYDLDENLVTNPSFKEIDGLQRMGIEFDGNEAFSLEYDTGSEEDYVYNASTKEELGMSGYTEDGFEVLDNQVAFHRNREYDSLNFDIGTLSPFTSTDGTVEISSEDAGRVSGFDFKPDGSEFIYGAFTCSDDGIGAGMRIKRVSLDTKEVIGEFLIDLPGLDADDMDDASGMDNSIRDLYVTDDYIVVMVKMYSEDAGFIQRYTYDGTLIEGIEIDHYIRYMAEGPNNSTLYLHPNDEDRSYKDVVQVKWNIEEESIGRPKSVISERSFGGKTIAEFKDTGFGLMKVVDPDTGAMDYKAPLKSDEKDVRLRIPFADMQAKLAAGANHLLINYQGQEISVPMGAFDCADLMASMPCQDDATIEIHLIADEAGNVEVTVQLFVVEQVDVMTKVVHRKTIQY